MQGAPAAPPEKAEFGPSLPGGSPRCGEHAYLLLLYAPCDRSLIIRHSPSAAILTRRRCPQEHMVLDSPSHYGATYRPPFSRSEAISALGTSDVLSNVFQHRKPIIPSVTSPASFVGPKRKHLSSRCDSMVWRGIDHGLCHAALPTCPAQWTTLPFSTRSWCARTGTSPSSGARR